ncbi:hypothetical protein CAEBREN_08193 [Caenorhabditis brenneri]|uniref:Uncharacterized protein n=1 Tax=Caenorhabditis brenneri TaxID=135651 RepID=G0P7A5_CAEBE|nr:hypothetical protein CAEBREN_08193 [Caenorhabditis brenneri]
MAKNPTNDEQKVSEAESEAFDTTIEAEGTSSSQQNEFQEQTNPENDESDAIVEELLKRLTKKKQKKRRLIDVDLYRVGCMEDEQLEGTLKLGPVSYKGAFYYSSFLACRLLNRPISWYSKYFTVAFDEKLEELIKDPDFKLPEGCFNNITVYSKLPMSALPVRVVFVMGWNEEKHYIFTEDVLETLPLLLQKMGKNFEDYKEKLEYLTKLYKTDFVLMPRCIRLTEFKRLLKELDIDQNLVQFFPDHDSALFPELIREEEKFPMVTAVDGDGDFVMTSYQAFFTIFNHHICEWDWSLAIDSKEKEHIALQFQKKFMKVTQKYLQMEEGTLVKRALVEADIRVLDQHRIYKKVEFEKRYLLEAVPFRRLIKWECYKQLADTYKLRKLLVLEQGEVDTIPAFLARTYLIFAAADHFFPKNAIKEMRLFLKALLGFVPEISVEFLKNKFDQMILRRAGKKVVRAVAVPDSPEKCPDPPIPQSDDKEVADPDSPEKSPEKSPEQSVDPPKPKTKKSKKKNLKGIACGNCYQANLQCGKLQKELKIAQEKADQYEKKAEKADHFETKLKEVQEQMEDLKRKKKNADGNRMKEKRARETAEKFSKDNKEKIEKFQKLEKDLKEARKSIQQKNEQVKSLEKKLNSKSKLEEQLKTAEERLTKRVRDEKELRSSKNELTAEVQKLKKQLEEQSHKMELDHEQFAGKCKAMESQIAGTRIVNDELNTANNNLKQTISHLESEVTVKTADLVEKLDTNFRLLIENERLTQKIQNLEIELERARQPREYSLF